MNSSHRVEFLVPGWLCRRRAGETRRIPLPAQASAQKAREGELTYRTLGKTGMKVTALSFGCMTRRPT